MRKKSTISTTIINSFLHTVVMRRNIAEGLLENLEWEFRENPRIPEAV